MARRLGDREIPILYTSILLTEAARASLHSGPPSSSLSNLIAGFEQFAASNATERERAWANDCARQLRVTYDFWRNKEKDLFGKR